MSAETFAIKAESYEMVVSESESQIRRETVKIAPVDVCITCQGVLCCLSRNYSYRGGGMEETLYIWIESGIPTINANMMEGKTCKLQVEETMARE